MSLNSDELKRILLRYLNDDGQKNIEEVHRRSDGRGGLIRLTASGGNKVIVKIWHARNLKEKIKACLQLSNGRREWRMHNHVYDAGVEVPRPIAYFLLSHNPGKLSEAMVIEDLGETESSMIHLKKLIGENNEGEVLEFEDLLIESTAKLLRLRIIDIDHQLNNFVVAPDGKLIRIDFECARRYPLGLRPAKVYARMLSRFITGHIHAVQPDVERSSRFAERLYAELSVDKKTRKRIADFVNENLEYQYAQSSIDTTIQLPR